MFTRHVIARDATTHFFNRAIMSERIERLFSSILVLTALVIAGTAIHREFGPSQAAVGGASPVGAPPVFTAEWKGALPIGELIGDSTAAMKVVVLSDLECPFCGRFHTLMTQVLAEHSHDVALVFVHLPLPMHRFALPAARAAECAGHVGRFREFVDVAYRKQDSLGLKSWGSFAREAGVSDTARIASCAIARDGVARIDAGLAFATKIGAHSTPTVIVNGWRFDHPPTASQLIGVLDSLRKGVRPFGGKT